MNKPKPISVQLDYELHEQFDFLVKKNFQKKSSVLRHLIRVWVDEETKKISDK